MNRTMTVAEAEAWVKQEWERCQKAAWQAHVDEQKKRADELAKAYENGWNAAMAKRLEPLTEEEIGKMWVGILEATHPSGVHEDGLVPFRFARAIERAHGIE